MLKSIHWWRWKQLLHKILINEQRVWLPCGTRSFGSVQFLWVSHVLLGLIKFLRLENSPVCTRLLFRCWQDVSRSLCLPGDASNSPGNRRSLPRLQGPGSSPGRLRPGESHGRFRLVDLLKPDVNENVSRGETTSWILIFWFVWSFRSAA